MGIETLGIGEVIALRDKRQLLREICEILGVTHATEFPGAQPVTMERTDLESLKTEDYFVCEKSDGVRALLFAKPVNGKTYTFLIDRTCTFLRVPAPLHSSGPMLFDGEIIAEKNKTLRFLIFDMAIYNGKNIAQETLHARLNAASRFLYDNRQWQKAQGGKSTAPLELTIKAMHKSYGLGEVYRKIIPELSHENDGLVFTCVNHPYQVGTCRAYLKWKPPHLNSIDFKLQKIKSMEGFYRLTVQLGMDREVEFGTYWVDPEAEALEENAPKEGQEKEASHYTEEIDYANLNGKIGEFGYKQEEYTVDPYTFDMEKGRWTLLRIRTDKNTANGYRTAVSIVRSIEENFEYTELESSITEIQRAWKAREKRKAELQSRGTKKPAC
ncbi:mRNA guanylyltransferase [Nematocida sp. AWRm77]|nr:mRNA guanylyltransferase [Nematocida sp. AWRm77]